VNCTLNLKNVSENIETIVWLKSLGLSVEEHIDIINDSVNVEIEFTESISAILDIVSQSMPIDIIKANINGISFFVPDVTLCATIKNIDSLMCSCDEGILFSPMHNVKSIKFKIDQARLLSMTNK
jgi:hypothetical protein